MVRQQAVFLNAALDRCSFALCWGVTFPALTSPAIGLIGPISLLLGLIHGHADLAPTQTLIRARCLDCHGVDNPAAGLGLSDLLTSKDPTAFRERWLKVEKMIASGKMPPVDADPLTAQEQAQFAAWFEQTFVMPGGTQSPGPQRPRRLTREELQNTLEDILGIDIRETVTNSRLHVIPDTVIEKFFTTGVRGASGFSNDAETLNRESIDVQNYARCFSLILSRVDASQSARETLFGAAEIPADLARPNGSDIVHRFAASAFRRDVTEDEKAALMGAYDRARKSGSATAAIRSAFLATLLSPAFLFRMESPRHGEWPVPVSDQELAIRLAYFLWSAPPDKELEELAEGQRLHEPKTLRQQVRRMLADPRRIALAENLGGEWFDYKQLRQKSAVNKRSDRMAGFYRTQYEEALLFFDSIIRFNQPLQKLVDADWAFLNPHQAGIYRLSTAAYTFEGPELPAVNVHYRTAHHAIADGNYEYKHAPLGLVKLQGRDRGGFVTLGPTLSLTSTDNRTSPIRRGVWIMERILGEHLEPPLDVPDLEATQKKAQRQNLDLTDNEILKLHSAQEGCASCHQYIDPIGFGLEVYDQLGVTRASSEAGANGEKLAWSPAVTPQAWADHTWTLKESLTVPGETRIYFNYTEGAHRLDIRKVRLTNGDCVLADNHFGFTGGAMQDNVWFFQVPEGSPAEGWTLTAEIKGDGGNQSSGIITVSGPDDLPVGYRLPNGNTFRTPAELKQLLVSDYEDQIIDNAIRRVLSYALGRQTEPVDRPAIRLIREQISRKEYRFKALLEEVVLSFPFLHK